MKTKQGFATGAACVALLLGLTLGGCNKPGPAEKAGKSIDSAAEKAGQQIKKAGDAIEKAAKSDKK